MVQAILHYVAGTGIQQKAITVVAVLLCGCGAGSHKPVHSIAIIPNRCIKSLNVTPETYCEIAPNGKKDCHNATVTYVAGCEMVVVPKSK